MNLKHLIAAALLTIAPAWGQTTGVQMQKSAQGNNGVLVGGGFTVPSGGIITLPNTNALVFTGTGTLGTGAFVTATGTNEDTREGTVYKQEAVTVAGSASQTILNLTGSAGTVNFIQLGVNAADYAGMSQSTLTITVDGSSISNAAIPLSTLFLTKGNEYNWSCPNTRWVRSNLGVSVWTSYVVAGHIRINIPFNSSCVITLTNGSTSSIGIYTQVQYNLGAPPLTAWGQSTRTHHLHAYVITNSTLTAYSTTNLLPTVTGSGQLYGVQLCVSGSASQPTWLEADPTLTYDGTNTEVWGGTEDFFGPQFYGQYIDVVANLTDDFGFPVSRTGAEGVSGSYQTNMYRFFIKDPRIFNSSVQVAWANGQPGEGTTPPTITYSSIVWYYL